jgi:hypothetical protein
MSHDINSASKLVAAKYNINVTSALYSSVFACVKVYLEGLFPPEFFRTFFAGNSNYSVSAAKNEDDDKIQEFPALAIKMNYEPLDASFAGDAFMHGNLHVLRGCWFKPDMYQRIAWDRNKGIYITTFTTRAKNSFEVNIRLASENQALNVTGYLQSRLGRDKPLFLNNQIIEVPLPTSLIASIAAAKGINLNNPAEKVQFNDDLTQISDGRITYKLHKSSGKTLYFYKYIANLLIKATGYNTTEKEVLDKAVMYSDIKFSIEVEYPTHTSFIAESYQNLPQPIPTNGTILDSTEVGAIFYSTFNTPVSVQLDTGEKCIFSVEIITEYNEVMDSIQYREELTPEVLQYFNLLRERDPTLTLIKDKVIPKVYRDGKELVEITDYEIDFHNDTLNVLFPYANYTHRFLLYTDLVEMNKELKVFEKVENI